MALKSAVAISGEDRLKCTFTMPATATNLNRHGAALQITRDLVVGSVILVKNRRGLQVSARIVSQLKGTKGTSSYGIEFVGPQEKASVFWGISFPPTSGERPVSRLKSQHSISVIRRER